MRTQDHVRLGIALSKAADTFAELKTLTQEELEMIIYECVIDGHHGTYVPQVFAEIFPQANCSNNYWSILKDGPDNEDYWDAWIHVSENWTHEGYILHLGESGDVFCYKPAEIEMWEAATGKAFEY